MTVHMADVFKVRARFVCCPTPCRWCTAAHAILHYNQLPCPSLMSTQTQPSLKHAFMHWPQNANRFTAVKMVQGNVGVAVVPGLTEVLDRDTNRLVPCTPTLCSDGMVRLANGSLVPLNRAPYLGPAAGSIALNPSLNPALKQVCRVGQAGVHCFPYRRVCVSLQCSNCDWYANVCWLPVLPCCAVGV